MKEFELVQIVDGKQSEKTNSYTKCRNAVFKLWVSITLLFLVCSMLFVLLHEKQTDHCNNNVIPLYNGENTLITESNQDFIIGGINCNLCPKSKLTPQSTEVSSTKSLSARHSSTKSLQTTPTTSVSTSSATAKSLQNDVRLPRTLSPIHYDIELQPNLYGADPTSFTFDGLVKVKFTCLETTNQITLHSNLLNIDESTIKVSGSGGGDPDIEYQSFVEDKERQFLIFTVNKNMTPGQDYSLEMKFSGPLKTDLKGLYLSSYQEAGKTKYLATTQFQPTDARKAFPCFDEPEMKAVFNITLVRKTGWTSLSNMDLLSSEDRGNEMIADHYHLTPRMSTYLVAFVVSQFSHTANTTADNIKEKAWARSDATPETNLALDVGIKILFYYEDLFGIKFPLDKQDMIAIPDYPLGAMEKWGLVTYRETALLYQPGISTESNKQRVVTVVAHEFSHQWFGNLVTMKWWDDLWLNEGFATFMEYVGTNYVYPEWKVFDEFTVNTMFSAFDFDGLKTSHPVYVPVNNPDDIGEIFDAISYSKGGSLVRMMKWFLGEQTFNNGLTEYLTKLSYKNAFHDDLWDSLQARATQDGKSLPSTFKEIMDTWIKQMNYPVVMVTQSTNGLHLTQNRFLLNKNSSDEEKFQPCCGQNVTKMAYCPEPPSDVISRTRLFTKLIIQMLHRYVWKIPFSYTTSIKMNFNVTDDDVIWFDSSNRDIPDLSLPDASDSSSWILGNVQQYGYYRKIPVLNRAQIINDVWNLAKAGEADMNVALHSVEYLDKEMSHVTWRAAKRELGYMDTMLSRSDLYGDFEKFMKMKVEEPYNSLTNSKDMTHLNIQLKSELTGTACSYGVSKCVEQAKNLYQSWMDDPQNIMDPNIKSTVYCTAISAGGQEEWNFAYTQYKQSQVASETALLMSALGCTREYWLLNHYLKLSLNPEEVRSQDIVAVITSVAKNVIGRSLAWEFIKENWDFFRKTLGDEFFSFTNLIKGVTGSFNTESDLQQLKQFIADHPDLGTGERAFSQAIESTESNIKWMNNNLGIIKSWLQKVVTPEQGVADVRLPRTVLPDHYDLELKPDIYSGDPKKFMFYGHSKIKLHCYDTTNNITMHQRSINIVQSSVKLENEDGSPASQKLIEIGHDSDREFVIFILDSNLQAGAVFYLSFDFSGPLKEDLHGFYLSSYIRGNDTIYMATSDFEPNDARKAFPCFDEPDIKTTYSITVLRKANKISLSNMPKLREETREDGYIADIFQETKKISTYLVAFIVCDFEHVSMVTKNNKTDSIWARSEYINQTSLALKTSSDILSYYEDYFDIMFPLPKQDLIAIPDFGPGAMENWGLITYKETYLLYKDGVSSAYDEQLVVEVIAHELGHQWFGDLVTMKWWDDLWLNEGFANFMEYFGTDHLHPDWKMLEQFTVNEIQKAFRFDELVTSHPIYVPVNSPSEIGEIFDAISYSKGGSVIRMMKHFLGESTFRKGLHNYLKGIEYGNAFHDDLWFALGNQSVADGTNINVKAIMDTWTLQMNYPVVMVSQGADGKLHVSQKRFLINPNATDPEKYKSDFGYTWKIPFTFTTSTRTNFMQNSSDIIWFDSIDKEITASSAEKADWIIANVQQYGYYRVNYDSQNWKNLISQLKNDHEVIHVINRAQLINDAWALAGAGEIDIRTALDTLQYLKEEQDYIPWKAANTEISYVDDMLSRTALYGQFQTFIQGLVKGPFTKLGIDNTNASHIQSLIRSQVVDVACRFSEQTCVEESKQQFQKWMDNPKINPIDPNLKGTVYCTAIREGDQDEWNFAYSQYKAASVAAEKKRLLTALACSSETWILSKYLDLTLDTKEIQLQDFSSVVIAVSRNPVGRDLTWNFVRANWDRFGEILGYRDGVFIYARSLLAGIFDSFNTEYDLQQMMDFHNQHNVLSSATQNFNQAVEKTQTNIRWMEKNYDSIEKWLMEADSGKSTKITDVRLPTSLLPTLYTLEIFPDFYGSDPETFSFSGYVHIVIDCKSATNNITLHANKLKIDQGSINVGMVNGQGSAPKYVRISEDLDRQFFIIHLDGNLQPGNAYFVEMNFTGPLKGDLAGLYLSSYQQGNKTIYMATTQFEATDARKAFPCFDEPEIKAKFKIRIVRRSDLVSLSNMPLISTTDRPNGYKMDEFRTSETMSTYLVAFIVCNFEHTEGVTKNNIKYGAWARPESINQTKLALQIGIDTITYYEDYFMVKFPLPKQDMIAIPDFAAGAMENWGLITYRETAMLYEEGVSSESNKQRVAIVIAHELAHQWFGDLVTMSWWDDLWLNEGFATYVEYMGADHAFPEWKMFDIFTGTIHTAMAFDGLVTSHPIYVPVQNPSEISEIFDSISYDKGGSVIRMMVQFLGEETFRHGVSNYLKNRKYRNAFHDDLWLSMTNQSTVDGHTLDVKSIMDTWTLQMNFPVITVRNLSNGNLHISQKRFLRNPDAEDPHTYQSPYGYKWKVPFTYTTSNVRNFNPNYTDVVWLDDNEKEIPLTTNIGSWVIGNAQMYGYYRVNYEKDNWLSLISQLKTDHKVIHLINRAQIINDAFALANAGEIDMDIALKTIEYLKEEDEYVPWDAGSDELFYIKSMLGRTQLFGRFTKFMKDLVEKQFNKFGLINNNTDHMKIYSRALISGLACDYDVGTCTSDSVKLFKQWMSNSKINPIDPNIKSTVYCTAISEGGWEEWNFAYQQYKTSTVVAEQSRLLSALSCTRQTWILMKYLDMTLDEHEIRVQDAIKVIVYISENPIGRDLTWNYVRTNFATLMDEYGGGSFSFANLFNGIFKSFNTDLDLQQMKEFQTLHPDMGSGTRAFAQAIEKTEANIQWMAKNYNILENWLPAL